jgi:hypothetical protein
MPTADTTMRQSQSDDLALQAEDCRTMARMCQWKADAMVHPVARTQWLDLAQRWRGLADQIDAGHWS